MNREHARKFRQDHGAELLEAARQKRILEGDKVREYARRNYHENSDRPKRALALTTDFRAIFTSPEEKIEKSRSRYRENVHYYLAKNRQWVRSHPVENRQRVRRYQMRLADAVGSYTEAEWEKLKAIYHHRCLCCRRQGVKLEADHVVPLSKGGSNTIDNIQPLCRSCNASKRDSDRDYRTKELDPGADNCDHDDKPGKQARLFE